MKQMYLLPTYILLSLLFFLPYSSPFPLHNSSLPLRPHPDPELVVQDLQRQVALSHRRALSSSSSCFTGNPIDDCWRCAGADWSQDRQRLAECGIGFGRNALGGKGGPLYVVTDSSDLDPVNPVSGTLRHAVIQVLKFISESIGTNFLWHMEDTVLPS